jgi:hypothetical protein
LLAGWSAVSLASWHWIGRHLIVVGWLGCLLAGLAFGYFGWLAGGKLSGFC